MKLSPAPSRCCSICSVKKPLDAQNFQWVSSRGSFRTFCRICESAKRKELRAKNPETYRETRRRGYANHRAYELARAKERRAASLDEARQRDHEYRQKNGEKIRARERQNYAVNPEKYRGKSRTYASKFPERRRQIAATYYAANRDRCIATARAWQKRNPEQVRATAHRRRVRLLNSPTHHTASDIRSQLVGQQGKCYWCRSPLGEKYHVDHIFAIARGGTNGAENICISCPSCNFSKNSKTPWDFIGRLF